VKNDRLLAASCLMLSVICMASVVAVPPGTSLVVCGALGYAAGMLLVSGGFLAWMTRP